MTNVLAPYGFRPVQERNGSPWSGKTERVIFADTDAVACFQYDLVVFTGDQILDPNSGAWLSVVRRATAAETRIAGSIVSFDYDVGENGYISYKRANQQITARIPADRTVLYSVQENATTLTSAEVEQNIDFVPGAGNTAIGTSTSAIDAATVGVTDTLPLRLVRAESTIDNPVDGVSYPQWLVTINQDAYSDKAGVA